MSKFAQKSLPIRIAAAAIVTFGCAVFAYGLVTMPYDIAVMAGVAHGTTRMDAATLFVLGGLWVGGTAFLASPIRGEDTDGEAAAVKAE